LAHFTDKSSTADVFAGAALVELLAEFIGGFSFAGLLDLGMRRRNLIGIGLPFYVSAVSHKTWIRGMTRWTHPCLGSYLSRWITIVISTQSLVQIKLGPSHSGD
jgi:hypothetical protein